MAQSSTILREAVARAIQRADNYPDEEVSDTLREFYWRAADAALEAAGIAALLAVAEAAQAWDHDWQACSSAHSLSDWNLHEALDRAGLLPQIQDDPDHA